MRTILLGLVLSLMSLTVQAKVPTIIVYLGGVPNAGPPSPELEFLDHRPIFKCAVGMIGKYNKIPHTPTGTFRVIAKVVDPVYIDVNGVKVAGPFNKEVGPTHLNVYGTRLIRLNYARNGRHLCIHGTNEPWLIPGYVSHMCIRMKNEEVEWLFDRVKVGDIVEIVP
ncbi:L,D-transpeptidase catalytic domain [uncultured archaeon]|nr:L,D-transpeptidase catalytic domain [uncultured archaeon]